MRSIHVLSSESDDCVHKFKESVHECEKNCLWKQSDNVSGMIHSELSP